ncbi:MAG: hypothetical protein ACRC4W_02305 [Treponemataceae bacterium]
MGVDYKAESLYGILLSEKDFTDDVNKEFKHLFESLYDEWKSLNDDDDDLNVYAQEKCDEIANHLGLDCIVFGDHFNDDTSELGWVIGVKFAGLSIDEFAKTLTEHKKHLEHIEYLEKIFNKKALFNVKLNIL